MDLTNDKYKRTGNNFLIIFLNSTSYYILAFLFLYLLSQFAAAIAGMQFGFSSIIYHYKLIWAIDSTEWTSDAVKLLYSLPPFLSLLIGFIFLLIYISLYDHTGKFKMFFLWTFAHGMIWFFGALLAGTILDKGFGYVVMYFYFLDTGKLIISLISLTLLLTVSTITTKWFLFSANSYFNQLNEHNRTFFTFSQVILPIVAGTAILIGAKLPNITYYELFVLLSSILFMLPIIMRYNSMPTFFFDEFPIKIKLDVKALVLAIVFLAAFRVLLATGIRIN